MLKVNEIFCSIDGEVNAYHQGRRTVFVRFAGCNLDCYWCDTKYARTQKGSSTWEAKDLVDAVEMYHCKKVTLTGGEPLIQPEKDMVEFCQRLKHLMYDISIETNGSIIPPIEFTEDGFCSLVFDYKLSGSGQEGNFKLENFPFIEWYPGHFLKFPIASEKDFMEAISVIKKWRLSAKRCAFSPIMQEDIGLSVTVPKLLEWMERERVDGIVNVQIHKLLNVR